MLRFARHLALGSTMPRTRHSYYRSLRLIQEYFDSDPAKLTEDQFRDYILFVKTRKQWEPKTIRQTAACAKLFFVEMLGRKNWTVFSQIRTKDHEALPAVLTREEVVRLLEHIRLRRYRIPIKLIYCCGLRLSECLGLTVHDIDGAGGKLWIRKGKGGKDRMVPIAKAMVEDHRGRHRAPGRRHPVPENPPDDRHQAQSSYMFFPCRKSGGGGALATGRLILPKPPPAVHLRSLPNPLCRRSRPCRGKRSIAGH